ncbi:PilN domain-containing protein [Oceanisphaera sp.]|uniref:PilN domain-containing protein n=1 Tax=Oceanisphaera sp. TaxID=1929979 RepID=UPI003A91BDF2
MHELELIPPDYRAGRLIIRRCIFGAALLAVASLLLLLATVLLSRYNDRQENQIFAMQQQHNDIRYQQNQLQELIQTRVSLQRELRFLEGLRSGVAVSELLGAVDQALGDSPVWFQEWSFRRASSLVDKPAGSSTLGYFILIKNEDSPATQQEALKLDMQMTIRGQSDDYLALSHFLRQLSEQPQIAEANLNRTSLRRYTNGEVLDFELTAQLNSGETP